MAVIRYVDDEQATAALAELLNDHSRRRPVAVITIPEGRSEPWIDVEEVAREAGELAEVYLMPTGSLTWRFSDLMDEGAQVYGGAGRVYPVGREWAVDLSQAPLRFAFSARHRARSTRSLISDLFKAAAAADLIRTPTAHAAREVSAVVSSTVAGRAVVDIGDQLLATIAEELTIADVPIDHIVTVGQEVRGWYDSETGRLDVTQSLRAGSEALATYSAGDVVLTRVVTVASDQAELMLYPETSAAAVVVSVTQGDVTFNPADELQDLMTVGEVIPARIGAGEPDWALVLNDVDDDEPIREAPSLLVGGPAWISERSHQGAGEPPSLAPDLLPAPPTELASRVVDAEPQPVPTEHREVDGLRAEIAGLTTDLDGLRAQMRAGAHEREQLRYLLDQAERRAHHAESEVTKSKARLRKAGRAKATAHEADGPQFADAEQGFRYLVLTRWASRTLPGEQGDRPLVDYVIGSEFIDSLDRLEGIKKDKVADVVVEIVTGLAPQLPGREVHRLRDGVGGDNPARVRHDGATAWRASLQVNTPSARRIHYWMLRSGQIELARVATHDDYGI